MVYILNEKQHNINSNRAKEHTLEMKKKYEKEIQKCIKDTKLYNNFVAPLKEVNNNSIKGSLSTLDSVSAVLNLSKGKTALLNFASYKSPGGLFMEGSMAQEECLCHYSFLYNVLSQHPDYYEYNNKNLNKSLYTNRALYSPNVIFEKNGDTKVCDVITCAAPYKAASKKYCNVSDEENTKALESRIKFVLDIAEDNKVETLILGAYGSGVFGQNPKEVAYIFIKMLKAYDYHFEKVIFAIPEGNNNNYESFKEVLLQK